MSAPKIDDEHIPLPQHVKADVIARKYAMAKSGIYEKARRGEIPCVRIGRSMRFDPAAVAAALKK